MTDAAIPTSVRSVQRRLDVTSDAAVARVRRRYRAEARFRAYGLMAIAFAAVFLLILLTDIVVKAIPAFTQTRLSLDLPVSAEHVDPKAPRTGDFDAVVRDATELGVTRVTVVRAARSIVKIDAAAADTKLDRWSRIAVEAARQCGRSDPPTVELADFEAAIALATAEARFVLDARAGRPLGALLKPVSTAFAIGPEGGFTESELELAKKNAFAPAFLGRFTMRTETAPAAVLGAFLSRT